MNISEHAATYIRERAAEYCESTGVPGYLAGVYYDGHQSLVAHGIANIATGMPMRDDTGFLFGSLTKVMTSTLVLQQVERGAIDLDERVITYLPEFKLTTAGAAGRIRVRHLLTHTNGIDADLFLPNANGPDALKVYVERLGQSCGALFAPDEYVSYSNGGAIVMGRLLEVVTGTSFHELLQRDVYAPVGMNDSSTSTEAAILRSTAVGHFPDPARRTRRTDMFKLPDDWASAGSTPIGPMNDLLAFGRTHLAKGVSPSGKQVISYESAARMQSAAYDMRRNIGLGHSAPNRGFGQVQFSTDFCNRLPLVRTSSTVLALNSGVKVHLRRAVIMDIFLGLPDTSGMSTARGQGHSICCQRIMTTSAASYFPTLAVSSAGALAVSTTASRSTCSSVNCAAGKPARTVELGL